VPCRSVKIASIAHLHTLAHIAISGDPNKWVQDKLENSIKRHVFLQSSIDHNKNQISENNQIQSAFGAPTTVEINPPHHAAATWQVLPPDCV
jgi:hypothetical protein